MIREQRISPTPYRDAPPKSYVLSGRGPLPPYGHLSDGRPYVRQELDWVSYDSATIEALIDTDIAAQYDIVAYYDQETYELVVEIPEGYDPNA